MCHPSLSPRRLPRLSVFVSGWSASFLKTAHQLDGPGPMPSLGSLEALADEASRTGFDGLEMSLSDLGKCRAERSEAAELIGSRKAGATSTPIPIIILLLPVPVCSRSPTHTFTS